MKGSVLPATIVTCTAFSLLTLPLAVFGSQSLQIEVQKEHAFSGKVKDIAAPYLAIAGCISVGAGVASLAVAEWRKTSRKSARIEDQLSELEQELKHKTTQIEELQLTESYLDAAGLSAFLEPIASQFEEPAVANSYPEVNAPAIVFEAPAQVAKPRATVVKQEVARQELAPVSAQPAVDREPALAVLNSEREQTPASALAQMMELQNQLRQIAGQVESLQSSLQDSAVPSHVQMQEYPNSMVDQLQRRLQLLESNWTQQKIAS